MIVVDASVMLPALAYDGAAGAAARARLRGESVVAPHLMDVEVVSGLRSNVRTGVVSTTRAQAAVEDLARIAVDRVPHRHLLPRAWTLRADISAYDAMYVALAELLEVALVTADARLGSAAGVTCEVEVLATPA
jgi:predicted nucleic acid-binding protein